jgi:hypothetical protein
MPRSPWLVLAAACIVMAAVPAHAQNRPCAKRAELLAHLESKFQEGRVAIGLADNGNLLEIFTSKDGSTWTVAMTTPTGITCLLATGQNWESVPPSVAHAPRT